MSDHTLPAAVEESEKEYKAGPHSDDSCSKWDPRRYDSLMTLGKGNYATVYLVESSETKQLYAMKVRSKKLVHECSEMESLSTEKTILQLAKRQNHPFIVKVFGGYQTRSHIMVYMEFCQGGDLMHHVAAGVHFDAERSKFYAAEVCLALKWFHDTGLLYRNLCLNDILLGLDGHIKLVDFIVSKIGLQPESKTKSFCGSSEFMAPEMLLDRPYDCSIDWWQLGVVTYQMLTRRSPFRGDDEDEVYDSILADEPLYPDEMTSDATDFVQKLLRKDPERRLGSGPDGAGQVMAHPFFSGINWDDLYHKRVAAPFIPTVANRTDVSNFEREFSLPGPPALSDCSETLPPDVQAMFQGFEFSAE